MDQTSQSTEAASRTSALRAIYRLRSGLPPTDRLEDLTVGAARLLPLIHSPFREDGVYGRCVLVTGDYGHGKTHILTLFREHAHASGFASCQLSIDGGACALNHPQRFLPTLLSTLITPGSTILGYEDLLHHLLADHASLRLIRSIVQRHLPSTREITIGTQGNLGSLLAMRNAGFPDNNDEVHIYKRRISASLTGQSLCHRAATPDVREMAYALLRVACEILKIAGHQGMALVIDEAESIYTKLPNARSRQGAHRVLAAICAGPVLQSCPVAVALTPDAEIAFTADIQSVAAVTDCLQVEPLRKWATSVTNGSVLKIPCRGLRPAERPLLLDRVFRLYMKAYPETAPKPAAIDWEETRENLSQRDVSIRTLVRHAVDLLDSHRYNPV